MGWVILFNTTGKSDLVKKYYKLKRYFLIDNSLKLLEQSWLLFKKKERRVSFLFTKNDGSVSSIKVLTKLKMLFWTQLPNIPQPYIGGQISDKKHLLASIVRLNSSKKTIIGSCCFRIFESSQFIELIFFAVSTKIQGCGHGALLMSFLKNFARSRKIKYIITCADNNAINFFLKQGFSTVLTNPTPIWFRHIREYEEVELMECVINPKNSYFFSYIDLISQKTLLLSKYQLLLTSESKKSNNFKKRSINFNLSSKISEKQKNDQFSHNLFTFINGLRSEKMLSPFFEPVDTRKMGITDYFDQSINSVDIRSLEEKIRSGKFILTKKNFLQLVKRMLNNSILYNGESHTIKEICFLLRKNFYFSENALDYQNISSNLV